VQRPIVPWIIPVLLIILEDFKYCFSIISKIKNARKCEAEQQQSVEAEAGWSERSSSVPPPFAEPGWFNQFNRLIN